MAKQTETTSCYMDGLRVKISEKYKPPPKITLAMTYAQRLSLNEHLQANNGLEYNFEMNTCIKQKMKEWRAARASIAAQRKEKLEQIIQKDKLKQAEFESLHAQAEKTNAVNAADNGLLIPTQSNILTPIQLAPPKYVQAIDDASPINISDFEPDTSSPFDNMELKTLNDLEELKLVLQNDQHQADKKFLSNDQETSHSYYNLPVTLPSTQQNQQSAFDANNAVYNSQPATSTADTNGYSSYYGNPDLYSFYNGTDYKPSSLNNFVETDNSESGLRDTEYSQAYNMVPDIIKALQNQLNLNIQDYSANGGANAVPPVVSSHMYRSKPGKPMDNLQNDEKLENPYHSLSKAGQNICESIASMGFPLARVARVCKLIGEDEKKVVEFLLVQSQLMDLGFSEEKVTSALSNSDHNRDKALELLIA